MNSQPTDYQLRVITITPKSQYTVAFSYTWLVEFNFEFLLMKVQKISPQVNSNCGNSRIIFIILGQWLCLLYTNRALKIYQVTTWCQVKVFTNFFCTTLLPLKLPRTEKIALRTVLWPSTRNIDKTNYDRLIFLRYSSCEIGRKSNVNTKTLKQTWIKRKLWHIIWKLCTISHYIQGLCSFCWNFTERQILWSLCSVDFHTLTLQLPIQTPHSVAPELQVFVSSLKFSVKRAHPCKWKRNCIYEILRTSTDS